MNQLLKVLKSFSSLDIEYNLIVNNIFSFSKAITVITKAANYAARNVLSSCNGIYSSYKYKIITYKVGISFIKRYFRK